MIRAIIFSLILVFGVLTAQEGAADKVYRLYRDGKFETLKKELSAVRLPDEQQRFYNTLFIKDGEKAFEEYNALFKAGQGRVKYLAAERLLEYYYSKGYYSTAADYQKFLVENQELLQSVSEQGEQLPVSNDKDEGFFIQVGAFGLEDNALQMQEMLRTQNVQSKIKQRNVQQKLLYCVWVTGKKDFEETLQLANELKKKYQLDYRIIKE